MRSKLPALAFIAAILSPATPASTAKPVEQESRSNSPLVAGKVYLFERITEGVYYTTSNGTTNTGGNHAMIVGDRDVVLVDAGATPAAARALLQDMKLITDKPVRYVINTHFHWDHTSGNSVFGPDVEIIGHDYVRHVLKDLNFQEVIKNPLTTIPIQIGSLKKQIEAENDSQKKGVLEDRLAGAESDLEQLRALKPFPPAITYSSRMTLHQGQREIQLLFLGPGHTGGDTVVFLPNERIVCTGDLMESKVSFAGNAFFSDWVKTLDALKELDFDTVLPGHGVPFHSKSLITAFQSYLKDFIARVAELRAQGLSAEEIAQKIDMTSHSTDFPDIQGPGTDVRGVRRVFEWMDGKTK